MGDFQDELRQLKREISDMLLRVDAMDSPLERGAKEQVKEYVDRKSGQLKERWETASQKTNEVAEQVSSYAKDNPWQTIAIAAAAGILIGSLIGKDRQ